MQEDVRQFEPDWILTDASVLDFSLEEAQIRWVLKHGTPIPLAYVREAVGRLSEASGGSAEELDRNLPKELEALLGGAYAGWAAESRRMNVPMTVVLLPRADKAAESPHLVALVHRLCARNGLHLIDVSTSFSGLSVEEFRVSDIDAHPSVLGHQRIFDALSKQLLREGFPAVIRGGGTARVTAAP
jgi:hypothetical protein